MRSMYEAGLFSIALSTLVFSILDGSPDAVAGNGVRVGNGGDVLVCPESVRLLDFYEAGFVPDSSTAGDAWEVATRKVQELVQVHPDLSRQFAVRLKEMKSELEFSKAVSLIDVPDSRHAFEPADPRCSIGTSLIEHRKPVSCSTR